MLDEMEKKSILNVSFDFEKSLKMNFDIKVSEMWVLREIKVEKILSNVERKLFFDKISRMLKVIRSINYNE